MSLLEVKDLTTVYFTEAGDLTAVDGVSFNLEKGESLGIAGESGCGKSTIIMSLMRLIKSGDIIGGEVHLDGISLLDMPMKEFRSLRWKKISLVPQAAMNALNPVYTVQDQIVEAILKHEKVKKQEARDRAVKLLEQVKVDPSRIRCYPHELSGGMRQRVMIAMALACNPDLIIADEVTTALDVVTQAQVLKLLVDIQAKMKIAIIFISHELSILAQTCNRIIVMYAGKIAEMGNAEDIFVRPEHPYTKWLLESLPDIKAGKKKLTGIPGKPPNLLNTPAGCRFNPRCPYKDSICLSEEPPLLNTGPKHYVACHHREKIMKTGKNKNVNNS